MLAGLIIILLSALCGNYCMSKGYVFFAIFCGFGCFIGMMCISGALL